MNREHAAWAACLVVVIILTLLSIPAWVSAVAMVGWLYYYVRWLTWVIQTLISA